MNTGTDLIRNIAGGVEQIIKSEDFPFTVTVNQNIIKLHYKKRRWWPGIKDNHIAIEPLGRYLDISWVKSRHADRVVPYLEKFLEDCGVLAPVLTWELLRDSYKTNPARMPSFVIPAHGALEVDAGIVFQEARRKGFLYFKPDLLDQDVMFCRSPLVYLFVDNCLNFYPSERPYHSGVFSRSPDLGIYHFIDASRKETGPATYLDDLHKPENQRGRVHLRGGHWMICYGATPEGVRQKMLDAFSKMHIREFSVTGSVIV